MGAQWKQKGRTENAAAKGRVFTKLVKEIMVAAGVPTAILSRQSAGVLDRSLIVNLPGKPASIRVCLDAVFPAIPYCIDLIGGPYLEGNPAVVKVFRPK